MSKADKLRAPDYLNPIFEAGASGSKEETGYATSNFIFLGYAMDSRMTNSISRSSEHYYSLSRFAGEGWGEGAACFASQ